jgi:hypothetical protein
MGYTLIPLGPGDAMASLNEVWMPIVFSDNLLLQCSLYTAAVQMSSMFGMPLMSNVDVVKQKAGALTLLIQRLADPDLLQSINDATLSCVLGIVGQVVCLTFLDLSRLKKSITTDKF